MPSLDVERRNERHWASVVAMARRGINAPVTSSAGRLFDAVAALLGVRPAVFNVLPHSQVPCNDGGISLGRAVVAAARTAPNNSYGPRTFI